MPLIIYFIKKGYLSQWKLSFTVEIPFSAFILFFVLLPVDRRSSQAPSPPWSPKNHQHRQLQSLFWFGNTFVPSFTFPLLPFNFDSRSSQAPHAAVVITGTEYVMVFVLYKKEASSRVENMLQIRWRFT